MNKNRALSVLVLLLFSSSVYAGTGNMPWDGPFAQIVTSITGPWAGTVALLAICVAGAVLVFGGELNQFFRVLVFIVLGVGLIIGAAQILQLFGAAGAVLITSSV